MKTDLRRRLIGILCGIFILSLLTASALGAAEFPALVNPGLNDFGQGMPNGWFSDLKLAELKPVGFGGVEMRALVDSELQGSLFQDIRNNLGNTRLCFSADVSSSKNGIAFLQVKLHKNGKETGRFNSRPSTIAGGELAVEVETGDADAVSVCCRMYLAGNVGETAVFKNLQFGPASMRMPKLVNPALTEFAKGLPKGWLCELKQVALTPIEKGGVEMRGLVDSEAQGAFFQDFKSCPPNTRLCFSADVSSSKNGIAFLQVKLHKDGKETGRYNSPVSTTKGGELAVEVETGAADAVSVYCRMYLAGNVGETAVFKNLQFGPAPIRPPALANGALTEFSGGIPKDWFCDRKQVALSPVEGGGVEMKGLINTEAQAALIQNFKRCPANARLHFSADVSSSKGGIGFLQVKLYKNGNETGRFNSRPSSVKGRELSVEVETGAADAVSVYCRMFLAGNIGETVVFKNLQFGLAPAPKLKEKFEVVPGFASAALYLGGLASTKIEDFSGRVKFRELPNGDWVAGYGLTCLPGDRQARGVLANLRENTRYEVAVDYRDNGKTGSETKEFSTLSPTVPIAKTIFLEPKDVKDGLVITESGAADGYIRYTARPGTVLRGPDHKRDAIALEQVEFIILENLTVRGGNYNCIKLNDCENIRVVNCDIADYGTRRVLPFDTSDERGHSVYRDNGEWINNQTGILVQGGSGIVLERNYIHDARSRANSWFYAHPAGPNAVYLGAVRGLVMRYNDFVGSDLHRWNDASEGIDNGSIEGGPWKDAEIYGNYFAFSNDDGIELDGGQINCRVFRNRFEGGLCGISTAPCLRGPSFLFDNLIIHLRDELGARNVAFKNNYGARGDGKIHLFNNLVSADANGVSGFGKNEPDRFSGNVKLVSRNNVFHTKAFFTGDVFREKVDLNFDLLSAFRPADDLFSRLDDEGQEKNALRQAAPFRAAEAGDFRVAGTLTGEAVPNFTPAAKIGNDLVLPERPLPFTASASQVNLDMKTAKAEITLKAADGKCRETFRIVQPEASDYFRVTPSGGVIEAGKTVTLTVEAVYPKVTDARINSGAFLIRTESGLSRPVSVYLDSRADEARAKARRTGAIYGKIEGNKLVFELKEAGKFYLFARFAERGMVTLNGVKMQVRCGDAAPEAECWGNIGIPQGKANAPLTFVKGRNELTVEGGRIVDCALGVEPEMFLYASENFAK